MTAFPPSFSRKTQVALSTASRRTFLKNSIVSGTALVLGVQLEAHAEATANTLTTPFETGNALLHGTELAETLADGAFEITPFIVIDKNGSVTLYNPRPDMGQGTYQALPAILADELDVPLAAVTIRQTEGAAKFGSQNAGGSSSIRSLWKPLRTAGAAARAMLVTAAAQTWSVPEADCTAENGIVTHRPSGKTLAYGALVEAANKLEIPKNPTLKDPAQFKYIGKPLPRPDVLMKVDGAAAFGIDAGASGSIAGLLYASIERSPVFWGKVKSYNEAAAKKIKGVKHVVKTERPLFGKVVEGVAVVADSYYAALQGRKALAVKWDEQGHDTTSTDALYKTMRESLAGGGARGESSRGDFTATVANAAKTLEAQYETPFVTHAPMEPEAVIARVQKNAANGQETVEIWTSTQGTVWTTGAVARHFKIPKENISVHPLFLGGSFGRKGGIDDFTLEAVDLAKKVNAPVKVVWSREDDITQGPFRPGMVSKLTGTFDASGKLVGLQHKYATASIQGQFSPLNGKFDDWTSEGVSPEDSPYRIPAFDVRFVQLETSIPVMWWRSVYASTNVFGHESFIDELAHAAGKDPLAFRLSLLDGSTPVSKRFQTVLQTLHEKARWNEALPSGKGRGVAIARSFESICAHAVTVGRGKDGKLRVETVVSVLDCGSYVNPDTVKAQTEGNIVMGLTAALKDAITFANGRAVQTNFDSYRVLRIHETPSIEVHIIQNGEAPGGVGEPGLPPVAPALANAIFAATGKRVRSLPMNLEAL